MPSVGVITFELRMPDAHSLKDKRHFVKGLKDRLRAKFNVAVAEKLSALRTADYFTARAARADIPKALKVLKRAGVGKPPTKGDELAPKKKRAKSQAA
jgi:hypothetical protein